MWTTETPWAMCGRKWATYYFLHSIFIRAWTSEINYCKNNPQIWSLLAHIFLFHFLRTQFLKCVFSSGEVTCSVEHICPQGWKDEMNNLKILSTKHTRDVSQYFAAHILFLSHFHTCNIAKVECTYSLKDQCLTERC